MIFIPERKTWRICSRLLAEIKCKLQR